MNQALRPPECMSMTTSASGKSTRVRKSASCSFGGPSGRPGNERLKFAPDGQLRVFAFDASGERTGMTMTRPCTCSGCSSCSSRSAATWPSYSSPWLPASTSTVGPSPFAIEAMWTNVLAQPAVFVIFGNARCPTCLPGAARSIVQETAGSRHASRARLQVAA